MARSSLGPETAPHRWLTSQPPSCEDKNALPSNGRATQFADELFCKVSVDRCFSEIEFEANLMYKLDNVFLLFEYLLRNLLNCTNKERRSGLCIKNILQSNSNNHLLKLQA